MAEPQDGRQTPERYEETVDPRNPPNSVVNPEVRRTALRVYLAPLIVLFIVVGLGLVYWANRGPVYDGPQEGVGTTGDRQDVIGERGNDADTPGGINPDPRPDSTREELEFRGAGDQAASTGPVTLNGVRVVGVRDDGRTFWVQSGDDQLEVTAPQGAPEVKPGFTVSLSGVREPDGQGGTRIRASRMTVQ